MRVWVHTNFSNYPIIQLEKILSGMRSEFHDPSLLFIFFSRPLNIDVVRIDFFLSATNVYVTYYTIAPPPSPFYRWLGISICFTKAWIL